MFTGYGVSYASVMVSAIHVAMVSAMRVVMVSAMHVAIVSAMHQLCKQL